MGALDYDSWKLVKIIVILKPGKSHRLTSSLLPCMRKLFERTFLVQITDHVNARKLLQEKQFGYISKSFNEIRSIVAVLLDIQKALDKVWHQGLIY